MHICKANNVLIYLQNNILIYVFLVCMLMNICFFAWVMCVSVLVYSLSEVFFIEPKYLLLLRASRSVVLMCAYSNWSLRVLGAFLIYQILFFVLLCPWLGISVCNIFSGRTWHFSCLYFYCAGSSLATSSWMYFGFALVSSWWHLVYANC